MLVNSPLFGLQKVFNERNLGHSYPLNSGLSKFLHLTVIQRLGLDFSISIHVF